MPEDHDDPDDLQRRFSEAISGAELADLRALVGDLGHIGATLASRTTRPDLRKAPLDKVAIYRIQVDLDHAQPPIWRQLDIRSDTTLDVLHQVIQAAFGWSDSHLYRFALSGHPFDWDSQLFLCPWEANEGDEDGIPAWQVRLDETLRETGDVLQYAYDYGDSWELTLRLEESLPAAPDEPTAIILDGERAAPPENSGGAVDAESLSLLIADPSYLDVEGIHARLRSPYFRLWENGIDQRLTDLVMRLQSTPIGEDLVRRLTTLLERHDKPDSEALAAALGAYQWFLDRAADGGITLTAAGYLKPVDVVEASTMVPAMGNWVGSSTRESDARPLLEFRTSLQAMGLLRKQKGALHLTRAGAAARRDPLQLWRHLADRMIPAKTGEFETAASLLLLAYASASPRKHVPLERITAALTELGWHHEDGRELESYELYRLPILDILMNVSTQRAGLGDRGLISDEAAALARAALRRAR